MTTAAAQTSPTSLDPKVVFALYKQGELAVETLITLEEPGKVDLASLEPDQKRELKLQIQVKLSAAKAAEDQIRVIENLQQQVRNIGSSFNV